MNRTVYKNASIVTGLSVAERALGFLYRIVLSRYIGAEGLGLYQVAHSLFSLFLTLATGGIPVALSRTVAQYQAENEPKKARAALTAGLLLPLLLALPVCLIAWIFGDALGFLFSDGRSLPVFRILLVGLCFACAYAAVRGYFLGNKRFLTASLLELTEEIVMVLAGVLLLKGVSSPDVGAERAAWSLAVADVLSCLIALTVYFLFGGKLTRPQKEIKPLFNATLPITFVRASGSLVASAVAVLLPAMLMKSGMGEGEALGLFGVVSGMVMPVLFIPATLIGSLALVLVPELAADFHQKREERLRQNIRKGLRFALLVACALIPFFYVLGEDFGRLAFSDAYAGEMLSKSCIVLLPMSIAMISTSMLNSIGFEKQTFLFFFFGAAALLLSVLLLPQACGGYAYVIGLGASYTVTGLCSLIFLQKKCAIVKKRWGQVCVQSLFPPLLCVLPVSLLGEGTLRLCYRVFGAWGSVFCTAFVMAGLTLALYFATKILSRQSLSALFRRKKIPSA